MPNAFEDKIADWSPAELVRYVRDQLTQDPVPLPGAGSTDELTIYRKLTISDEVAFLGTAQATVGAAGTATAPPANPVGYIRILDGQGTVRVIPYYNQ